MKKTLPAYEGYTLIQEAFEPLFHQASCDIELIKLEIAQDILTEAYENAIANHEEKSTLFEIIASIPKPLSLEEKTQYFCEKLELYSARPVITAHPTRVLSNTKAELLCQITDSLPLKKNVCLTPKDKARAIRLAQSFPKGQMVPEKNLSADDEAAFALFLYQRMLSSFPEFYQETVQEFMRVHGGKYAELSVKLKPALMESYRRISSWCMADFDGNKNRTRETLEKTVPSQQKAILELYLTKLKSVLKTLDMSQYMLEVSALRSTEDYFKRCVEAIDAGILFDVAQSEAAKKRVLKNLNEVIVSFARKKTASMKQALIRQITAIQDLVDLAGFFGGLKEYTRQTTQLNHRVLDNLLSILKLKYPEFEHFMKKNSYETLSAETRHEILTALRQKPRYFKYLKEHTKSFHKETVQEINRLSFILEHSDIFSSYICSDTEDKVNLEEMLLLFHFSAYMFGHLHIGQIRQYPVNPMILCETPEDIRSFKEILTNVFEDPAIRTIMMKAGLFSYVGGPSDLGKHGGILTYLALLRATLDSSEALETYKKYDERLSHVTLWVLNGFGGDLKRRNGASAQELHATHQGLDALRNLGATGAYRGLLHRVVGHPPESYFRAQELLQLRQEHPKAYHALEKIEMACVHSYKRFMIGPENKALLSLLTSFELEKAANISSRAGAKTSLEDPTDIRAIGLYNLYLLTAIPWDVFMSASGINELPKAVTSHLPLLLNKLTTLKDIAYKIWFSIAVSDFEAAELKVKHESDGLKSTLAYIECTAKQLLEQGIKLFPENKRKHANSLFKENQNLPANQIALALMDLFEEGEVKQLTEQTYALLPRFKRLQKTVEAYRANPSPETQENAVLALRGGTWVTGGPRMIEAYRSPLHVETILGKKTKQT